ncbi:bifunctional indole-3-glycerol-phosphate synthase TrpC/phosphoribosylanthranilate isomerase TrpF [Candidatus Tremblaya phenacola]|uniref:bifunctional indole-3-glycerol-phosphate synthase TrpC/phosphoribosylanthranilate isomerase TrpF n=1 Tax=Candidatus Tremblayella phenacoccinincola TaxID=1010676 RepID=UPI001330794D|nr:bifunctional indole-3-glycerol-phosphate synthase TrpC/phosphoribosylanthranilate isomerase TrpF [Candidatus Tremblaya phenacola]KAH0998224.1 Indole-3-glycerol phosphate synthase [Candidatus Tremblaya phenacola]
MNNRHILNSIIRAKKLWVYIYKNHQHLGLFQQYISLNKRSFYNVLSSNKTIFIIEYKSHSPSKGKIGKLSKYRLHLFSKICKSFSSVISVLTDEKHFFGSFSFLYRVSSLVKQPILCKDFIIDAWQIYLARFYGANVILLLLSALKDSLYIELYSVANSLNMGVLTEIIDRNELQRTIKFNIKVIGINNRNLDSFLVNVSNTIVLAPEISTKLIIVSESGILSYQEIVSLSYYVNGFLIGTSINSEPNLNTSFYRMLFGKNKICGLLNEVDIINTHTIGSFYGGLIFIGNSSRFLTITKANIISSVISLSYVGVFDNKLVPFVSLISKTIRLRVIQLHGFEEQTYINILRQQLPFSCLIWKAFNVRFQLSFLSLFQISNCLLDCGGGCGSLFDWSLVDGVDICDVILAGGLSELNCAYAARLDCFGLDLNSKLEMGFSSKSYIKLYSSFERIRTY